MNETRAALLEAATRVMRREGSARLTLDAVAREAGVSKGGLLYHFSSKEALLRALLDEHLGHFDEALRARQAEDAEPAGRWARAYLGLTLAENPASDPGAALLAAVALDPELLSGVRDRYARWQACAEADDLPPGLGTLLRLAADGLWLAEFLGLAPPGGEARGAFARAALALTHPGETP